MDYLLFFLIFILGTAIGSFLNVLIDRLPKGQSIDGRSVCDYCSHQLPWYDLFPIVSFLLLKGKCRYCRKKISFQYPLVEFLTGVSFLLVYFHLFPLIGDNLQLIKDFHLKIWEIIGYWIIFSSLIVIFFTDAKYHLIPDSVQLSFFIGSLILLPFIASGNLFYFFVQRVFASLVVAAPIFALHFFSQGKVMGFGDVKLAFTIGFLMGIKMGFLALYLAFIIGGVVGLILILTGRKKLKSKIAFGPFLVFGILSMIFFGRQIVSWF